MQKRFTRYETRNMALFLLLFFSFLLLPRPAFAGWTTKDGNDYYVTKKGKTLTGWQVLKGKTYYFDQKGKQMHGFVKVGTDYYCFSQERKEAGSLCLTGTPGGFNLEKKGKLLLPTPGEETRMKAFVYVSKMLHKKTRSSWSKKKKLKAMYNYASKLTYLYDDTDKTAAECVLKFKKQIDGDCADTNSFLAFCGAVLGYRSYVMNDCAHWWGLVGGFVLDTNFFQFYTDYPTARRGGYSYHPCQAIRVDSPYAGSLMMTVHPDRYDYDTKVLMVFDDHIEDLSFALQ